jgi:hypothetical protein
MSAAPHDSQGNGRSTSFWAVILIAIGVIWLLLQADILSSANLVVLFRLWPIILVAVGLELLIGRNSRSLSLLIGAGTIVLLGVLMVFGPSLGLATPANVQTVQYSEPLDDAKSAKLDLDFSVGDVNMQALSDSNMLLDADLRYIGNVDFESSTSNGEKLVTLTSHDDSRNFFDFLGFSFIGSSDEDSLHWEIGLNPTTPLDLNLKGGVGTNTLDLSGVQLSSLRYDGGVGGSTVSLPSGSYDLDLNAGVGALNVKFMDDTAVDASIVGGVGKVTLDLPEAAPVRLEVEGTLGGIDVPENFVEINSNQDVDESGVWESASYAEAGDSARIRIVFDGGVGGLSVE